MTTPNVEDYPLTQILPNKTKAFEVPPGANGFYVISCSHSRFSTQINDGRELHGELAFGRVFKESFSIEKVRVKNLDASLPLDITIQVGEGVPIANVFKVSAEEVTPILRSDTPFIVGEAVKTAPADVAVDTWIELLPAEEFRAEVWLKTDAAAGEAFWATSDPAAPAEFFSRDIQATADTGGFLRLKTTAAIWVRLKSAKSVRAITFKYAV